MKISAIFLLFLGAFFGIVGLVYWFWSYEDGGGVMLLGVTLVTLGGQLWAMPIALLAFTVTPGIVEEGAKFLGSWSLALGTAFTGAGWLAIHCFDRRTGNVVVPSGGGVIANSVGGIFPPIKGAPITSLFGMRFHPILHILRLHAPGNACRNR